MLNLGALFDIRDKDALALLNLRLFSLSSGFLFFFWRCIFLQRLLGNHAVQLVYIGKRDILCVVQMLSHLSQGWLAVLKSDVYILDFALLDRHFPVILKAWLLHPGRELAHWNSHQVLKLLFLNQEGFYWQGFSSVNRDTDGLSDFTAPLFLVYYDDWRDGRRLQRSVVMDFHVWRLELKLVF